MGQTKMRFQPAFWLASFNKAKEFLYFQDVDTGGTQGDAYACHSTKDSVSFMVTGEKLSQVSILKQILVIYAPGPRISFSTV